MFKVTAAILILPLVALAVPLIFLAAWLREALWERAGVTATVSAPRKSP